MYDLVIDGGLCPDFQEGRLVRRSVGIRAGKIEGLSEEPLPGRRVIDGAGKIVSPGFIDIHMHEEDFAKEGDRYTIAEMMLRMGVTTCLGGNCGLQRQRLSEFKAAVNRLGGSPVNYLMMAGYNSFRSRYAGCYEPTTEQQRRSIRELLRLELEQGARGISFGIEYDPAIDAEEMSEALDAFDDSGLLVSVHYRAGAARALESVREMTGLATVCGKRFQISHLSSCAAMGQMEEALQLIRSAMKQNPRLGFDTYPYSAFSTHLGSAVFDEGCFQRWGKGPECIMLTQEPYKNRFCDEELFHRARREYPSMLAVVFAMNEEEIAAAVADPAGMVASDAIVNGGQGHPRGAGTFPRLFAKYVREEGVVSMIDALRKVTLLPARQLGLCQKGRLEPGCDADIVIFDAEEIQDCADFSDGSIPPRGVEWVIINGREALRQGEIRNGRCGRFISRQECAAL